MLELCREQMLQVLLRITEAVMKRPQENQRKDSFAENLASVLFRVCLHLTSFALTDKQDMFIQMRVGVCVSLYLLSVHLLKGAIKIFIDPSCC